MAHRYNYTTHKETIDMPTTMKWACFCYGFNVVGLFLFGLIYTFSGEFLPFHSDAIQASWESLSPATQVLYLGMMKTEGAGFLSSALAIGIVELVPGLVGAYNTSHATPASSPWQLSLLGIVLLIVGLMLSLSGSANTASKTEVVTGP